MITKFQTATRAVEWLERVHPSWKRTDPRSSRVKPFPRRSAAFAPAGEGASGFHPATIRVQAARSPGPSQSAGGAPVAIREVVVRYPATDRAAVDGVSLDVAAGEFVVLLGPSGCGKSTLLRTINRLVVPASGTIEVDGRNVEAVAPEALRRGIGYVIQAVGLFPHMTIGTNIGIVPGLLGWDPARIAARVDELLSLVKLEPDRYRTRLPRELSGGEQQRVGVARALAAEPRVLLMDEPFGAVDAIVRTALQDETLRIHRALGTTILFVTHDVDEALRIADRIVIMNAGTIVQADTPLRVLARPATPYVEHLMNAKDTVRRLGLIRVRDALKAAPEREIPSSASGGTIAADATLREALSQLLEGAARLDVRDGDTSAGVLDFDGLRHALTAVEEQR